MKLTVKTARKIEEHDVNFGLIPQEKNLKLMISADKFTLYLHFSESDFHWLHSNIARIAAENQNIK